MTYCPLIIQTLIIVWVRYPTELDIIAYFCFLLGFTPFDQEGSTSLKTDMNSDIPLETAAIFFLANLFLKQGTAMRY